MCTEWPVFVVAESVCLEINNNIYKNRRGSDVYQCQILVCTAKEACYKIKKCNKIIQTHFLQIIKGFVLWRQIHKKFLNLNLRMYNNNTTSLHSTYFHTNNNIFIILFFGSLFHLQINIASPYIILFTFLFNNTINDLGTIVVSV